MLSLKIALTLFTDNATSWATLSYEFFIDLNIPFLVLTGDEDPINENGKQAEEISNLLIECGFKSEFKSYQGMRHEPLTELERDIVMKRIGKFFGSNV